MPVPVSRSRRRIAESWLLNFGAVLGSVCLVLATLALIFGITPLIFASGSMGPAIPTGSLALAVPEVSSEISPGEVVSVVRNDGVRLTHRVVSVDPATGLVLKGDANAVTDLLPYTGRSVDKVLFSVPGLGYVAAWLASPWALVLGGSLCPYLIYAAFFRAGPPRSSSTGDNAGDGGGDSATDAQAVKPGSRRRTWFSVGAIVTTLAVVVPLGAASSIDRTQAAWLASATAVAPIAAVTLVAPTGLSCQNAASGNRSVTVKWVAPSDVPVAVDHYKITVTVGGKSKQGTVPASATSQVLSLDDGQGLLGGVLALLGNLLDFLLGGAKPVGVNVVAVYPGGWESTAIANSGVAEISSYALVSTRILCK